jgi:hypothetical protein
LIPTCPIANKSVTQGSTTHFILWMDLSVAPNCA